MNIPTIQGIIKRRILINYRADPKIVQNILPEGFKPKLRNDFAIAGICCIRLERIRPKRFPSLLGVSSENAAHRIAVEWEEGMRKREGVFIPRRDTDSTMTHFAGGTLFPSEHSKAAFEIKDNEGKIDYSMCSIDGEVSLTFVGKTSDYFPSGSAFASLNEASQFFERGSLGYSTNKRRSSLDGISLDIEDWRVSPFNILWVESSYYTNEAIFPKDSIEFDHALLMRDIKHKWHSTDSFEPQ